MFSAKGISCRKAWRITEEAEAEEAEAEEAEAETETETERGSDRAVFLLLLEGFVNYHCYLALFELLPRYTYQEWIFI